MEAVEEDKSGRNREEEQTAREAPGCTEWKKKPRRKKGAEMDRGQRSRKEEQGGGGVRKREGGGSAERIYESASRRHFIMSPFTETFSFTL